MKGIGGVFTHVFLWLFILSFLRHTFFYSLRPLHYFYSVPVLSFKDCVASRMILFFPINLPNRRITFLFESKSDVPSEQVGFLSHLLPRIFCFLFLYTGTRDLYEFSYLFFCLWFLFGGMAASYITPTSYMHLTSEILRNTITIKP